MKLKLSFNKLLWSLIFCNSIMSCNDISSTISLAEVLGIEDSVELVQYLNKDITERITDNLIIDDSILLVLTPSMCSGCKQVIIDLLYNEFYDKGKDITIIICGNIKLRELYYYDFKDFKVWILKTDITLNDYNSDFRPILLRVKEEYIVQSIFFYDKHVNRLENVRLLRRFFSKQ